MTQEINLNQIREEIIQGDIDTKIELLNNLSETFKILSQNLINIIQKSENKMLISDITYNILNNSKILEKSLENTFRSSNDKVLCYWVGIILLEMGNQIAKPYLLDVIENGTIDNAIFAAVKLSKFDITDAIKPIQNRLLHYDYNDLEYISPLLDSLEKLNGHIPTELINKLKSIDLPWHLSIRLPKQS
jgi:hypothetical protein